MLFLFADSFLFCLVILLNQLVQLKELELAIVAHPGKLVQAYRVQIFIEAMLGCDRVELIGDIGGKYTQKFDTSHHIFIHDNG